MATAKTPAKKVADKKNTTKAAAPRKGSSLLPSTPDDGGKGGPSDVILSKGTRSK